MTGSLPAANTTFSRMSACHKWHSDLWESREAAVVQLFNDACVAAGRGKCFYLPEPDSNSPRIVDGNVHYKSIIPRLLYSNQEWELQDRISYASWSVGQWHLINHDQITDMNSNEIFSIQLILTTSGLRSLSFPAKTLAKFVIYGNVPHPKFRLSRIDEWIAKATLDETGEIYTVPIYQAGTPNSTKASYYASVNALGEKTFDIDGLLGELQSLARPIKSEGCVSASPKGMNYWVRGRKILNILEREYEVGDSFFGASRNLDREWYEKYLEGCFDEE